MSDDVVVAAARTIIATASVKNVAEKVGHVGCATGCPAGRNMERTQPC